ncbi:predicted protein [Sclerotinia sclerotiorum 1980 UF-70]|uniref:Uncharacterized protein n=1 Tax=Sclerotinia sclerotiorum (strain ATCC 18683 / 1980 / Ss-1) TaxID=665079 RepID=A7EVM9_SCLS1|nr:predicted protein [Sclerotinia sclerotiorum 1980 UF-70]EDN93521.1 predicted protein [Sclerotinia sclerotiorum 1980 UF-70]
MPGEYPAGTGDTLAVEGPSTEESKFDDEFCFSLMVSRKLSLIPVVHVHVAIAPMKKKIRLNLT